MSSTATVPNSRPWPALWALLVGFFMILVDSTIVSVATPAIMTSLDADLTAVVWVSSAYLLAYAVPLMITGRLGDRFGQRTLYIAGLGVFTLASAGCGLADSIGLLILARVVQGLGAALMAPQTMSIITRIFPPERRGTAMGLWGATAGVATLVGPILGGVLVDTAGWPWIFYVNVPVGLVGIVLALRFVPALSRHAHRFDLLGVALSAIGMFCIVFGIQEGQRYDWGVIEDGPLTVWSIIAVGIIFLSGFLLWQFFSAGEPLLPLVLFVDRNFALANVAIGAVGFAVTAMALPLMLYMQSVRGLSPTVSALLLVPMAVITAALSPLVGRLTERIDPRWFASAGLACFAVALAWLGSIASPEEPIWRLELPIALLGVANALVWSPLSISATRNLPSRLAGAGSGVYNTLRQVGAVLGAAAIAAVMQSRLTVELGAVDAAAQQSPVPAAAAAGFSAAMGQSLLLPAAVLVVGLFAVLGFAPARPRAEVHRPPRNMAPAPYPPAPSSPSPAPGRPVPPADPPRWNQPSGRRAAR